jgi:hypothetical protein
MILPGDMTEVGPQGSPVEMMLEPSWDGGFGWAAAPRNLSYEEGVANGSSAPSMFRQFSYTPR